MGACWIWTRQDESNKASDFSGIIHPVGLQRHLVCFGRNRARDISVKGGGRRGGLTPKLIGGTGLSPGGSYKFAQWGVAKRKVEWWGGKARLGAQFRALLQA